MFPKTGRKLPPRGDAPIDDYASFVADALRLELGNSHQSIKTLMRWTGANERTMKNWLSGTNGPSGEHLLEILCNSDLVFDRVLQRVDRRPLLSYHKLEEVHEALRSTAQMLFEMIKAKELPKPH